MKSAPAGAKEVAQYAAPGMVFPDSFSAVLAFQVTFWCFYMVSLSFPKMFGPGGYHSGGSQTTPLRRRKKKIGTRPENFGFLLVRVLDFSRILDSFREKNTRDFFRALRARDFVTLLA